MCVYTITPLVRAVMWLHKVKCKIAWMAAHCTYVFIAFKERSRPFVFKGHSYILIQIASTNMWLGKSVIIIVTKDKCNCLGQTCNYRSLGITKKMLLMNTCMHACIQEHKQVKYKNLYLSADLISLKVIHVYSRFYTVDI